MWLHGISPLSILLILVIVLIIFGGKKLQQIGNDLGSALRNFRKGMEEDNKELDKTRIESEINDDKDDKK